MDFQSHRTLSSRILKKIFSNINLLLQLTSKRCFKRFLLQVGDAVTTIFVVLRHRIRMVGVQAAVGGRSESLHQAVVELAWFHHAVTIPVHVLTASCRLLPFAGHRPLRTTHDAAVSLARGRPNYRLRGRLRYRQRVQFCTHYFPLSSEPATRPAADLARLYAHRHRQVLFHLLSRHYVVRMWTQPALLLLLVVDVGGRSCGHHGDGDRCQLGGGADVLVIAWDGRQRDDEGRHQRSPHYWRFVLRSHWLRECLRPVSRCNPFTLDMSFWLLRSCLAKRTAQFCEFSQQ